MHTHTTTAAHHILNHDIRMSCLHIGLFLSFIVCIYFSYYYDRNSIYWKFYFVNCFLTFFIALSLFPTYIYVKAGKLSQLPAYK